MSVSPTHRTRRQQPEWALLVVVLISGMSTMAVEMAASRLLGPYFGDSILVWANLIGLILVYLTVGAYLGGRWADRSPRPETLYTITLAAAMWIGLVPLIAAPVLRLAQQAFTQGWITGEVEALQIGGSFVGVLILLAPPVTLLGCVSPYAIRLSTRQIRAAGSSAGRIYALSTVGSIAGTFAPVLLTIPAVGTARTFVLVAVLLSAASLLGLLVQQSLRRAAVGGLLLIALLVLTLLLGPRTVKADAAAIAERESRYNYIQVLEIGGVRYLMLNEGQGVHSVYDPRSVAVDGTWDVLTVAPFFNNPPFLPSDVGRICIIGLAGGTVARQATAAYGPLPIDGVEIDPQIVEVGRQYFGMDQPNLGVFVTDGRFFLAHTDARYDLIVVDAYRLPYIPFQLATREFFDLVKAHLTPRGVVAINVGRTESDYRMVESLAATLRTAFASVHAVNLPMSFNTVLVATQQETDPENLLANLEGVENPFLQGAVRLAAANLHPLQGEGMVFTDDRAPVEQLTNAIILRYLLVGQ